MKNYIGFVNDHSGSMRGIHRAAAADYNANSEGVQMPKPGQAWFITHPA